MNTNTQLNICEVCETSKGTIGFHYGVIICEACKKFFVRSEKNNTFQSYKCNQIKQCFIMVTSRANCQYCRYKKCKQLGMNLKFNLKSIPDVTKIDENCQVCMQKASGNHFGVDTCEGCKSFFMRSSRKDKYKEYKCKANNQCEINICKSCRFEKCSKVGMSNTGCKIGRKSNITKVNGKKRYTQEQTDDIIESILPPIAKRTRKENASALNDQLIDLTNNTSNNNTIDISNDYYDTSLPDSLSFQSFQPFNIGPSINMSNEYENQYYNNNTNFFQQDVPFYSQNIQMLTPVYMITSSFEYNFNQELINSSLTNLVAKFNE